MGKIEKIGIKNLIINNKTSTLNKFYINNKKKLIILKNEKNEILYAFNKKNYIDNYVTNNVPAQYAKIDAENKLVVMTRLDYNKLPSSLQNELGNLSINLNQCILYVHEPSITLFIKEAKLFHNIGQHQLLPIGYYKDYQGNIHMQVCKRFTTIDPSIGLERNNNFNKIYWNTLYKNNVINFNIFNKSLNDKTTLKNNDFIYGDAIYIKNSNGDILRAYDIKDISSNIDKTIELLKYINYLKDEQISYTCTSNILIDIPIDNFKLWNVEVHTNVYSPGTKEKDDILNNIESNNGLLLINNFHEDENNENTISIFNIYKETNYIFSHKEPAKAAVELIELNTNENLGFKFINIPYEATKIPENKEVWYVEPDDQVINE